MSLTGAAAPSQAARDSIAFWHPGITERRSMSPHSSPQHGLSPVSSCGSLHGSVTLSNTSAHHIVTDGDPKFSPAHTLMKHASTIFAVQHRTESAFSLLRRQPEGTLIPSTAPRQAVSPNCVKDLVYESSARREQRLGLVGAAPGSSPSFYRTAAGRCTSIPVRLPAITTAVKR